MRILVVDDEIVSRMKLKKMLSLVGECDAAETGKEALVMIEKAVALGKPYRLITMDINMPDLKGQEVVKAIRQREDKRGVAKEERAKVIMVTIERDGQNIMSSFEQGCEWFLSKPVTPEKLRESLAKVGVLT